MRLRTGLLPIVLVLFYAQLGYCGWFQEFLDWFGLTHRNMDNVKLRNYPKITKEEFLARPIADYYTGPGQIPLPPRNATKNPEDENYYRCWVCADRPVFQMLQQLNNLLSSSMRHPSPRACAGSRYSYQIMCQGPCSIATYWRERRIGREHIGIYRDCLNYKHDLVFSKELLNRQLSYGHVTVKLPWDSWANITYCRNDYCNIEHEQPRETFRAPTQIKELCLTALDSKNKEAEPIKDCSHIT
ncbi:unnamed protein product, partial [Mesorhabditis spiculigera]